MMKKKVVLRPVKPKVKRTTIKDLEKRIAGLVERIDSARTVNATLASNAATLNSNRKWMEDLADGADRLRTQVTSLVHEQGKLIAKQQSEIDVLRQNLLNLALKYGETPEPSKPPSWKEDLALLRIEMMQYAEKLKLRGDSAAEITALNERVGALEMKTGTLDGYVDNLMSDLEGMQEIADRSIFERIFGRKS